MRDYDFEKKRPDDFEHKQPSGLGIASLVVGIVGLLIGLIPCFGIAGIPIAGVGLLLGIAGLLVAGIGKRESMSFPIAGTSVSLAGIVVSGVMYFLVLRAAHNFTQGAGQAFQGFAAEMQRQQAAAEEARRQEEARRKEEDARARREARTITAAALLQEFNENLLKADDKYRDKWLRITGKITRLDRVAGNQGVVDFKAAPGKEFETVRCFFNPDEVNPVRELKVGDEVKILGKCQSKRDFYVALEDSAVEK